MIEFEAKFPVKNVSETINKIRKTAKFVGVEYILDTIYGCKQDKKKIRLRVRDNFKTQRFEALYKNRKKSKIALKTEIEESIFKGTNLKDALKAIGKEGKFKPENSYEKLRAVYRIRNIGVVMDFYPYGVWLEVEGPQNQIWKVAGKLGFKKKSDSTNLNADELYLKWNKKKGLKELWHVRFGLD